MTIQRMRVGLGGLRGLPGLTTFYFSVASSHSVAVGAFFDAVKAFLPIGMTVDVPSSGDIIDDTTGTITGTWTGPTIAGITGTNVSGYAAPAGAAVTWRTGFVHNGHRVRGRSYIVPIGADNFAVDGTLIPVFVSNLTTYATSLIAATSLNMVIWSRPRAATSSWTHVQGRLHPAKVFLPGTHSQVLSATVTDAAAILTSRRD